MTSIKPNCTTILINLAEDSIPANDGTEIGEEDLLKMKGVHSLYKAHKDIFGKRLCLPVLIGTVLHIDILPDSELVPYFVTNFVADVEAARDDLHHNADLHQPLPHSVAVRKPNLVSYLKAGHCAAAQYQLSYEVHTEEGVWHPPELSASDFTEPLKDKDLRQTGEWLVVGLRRDDRHGHRLIVTSNDLIVVLPLNDKKWSWLAIHYILDQQMALVGTLIRENKASSWVPDPSTKLEPRENLQLI